jgi:hypothetical protein
MGVNEPNGTAAGQASAPMSSSRRMRSIGGWPSSGCHWTRSRSTSRIHASLASAVV